MHHSKRPTHHSKRPAQRRRTAALVLALSLVVCGLGTGVGTSASGATARASAAVKPPPALAKSGVLHVCTDPGLGAPFVSQTASGAYMGEDMAVARRVAALMGLKASISTVGFVAFIPAIENGTCDIWIDDTSNTPARAKVVHFTNYITVGSQVMVPKGNPLHIHAESDLAGHTVGVIVGSTQYVALTALNKTLTTHGKPAMTLRVYSKGTDAVLAMETNTVDALDLDYPEVAQAIKQFPAHFQYALAQPVRRIPSGIASKLTDTALSRALAQAVKGMYADRSMKAILAKYGLSQLALK